MSPRVRRAAFRAAHLLLAAAIGCYVYFPDSWALGLKPVIMAVVFPLALISGLAMWGRRRVRVTVAGP
ncbi:hypothetical protein [Glycomyces tenuis]|uniref:hypothetical protein n=1 Tax=Glycomyces tenuis TaxID=58116 RepID=UPI0004057A6A|nr:hypothetical protein [Glycomyces tenuis]